MSTAGEQDERTPSPPFGYSRPCTLDRDAQLRVVAQFHAHRIRPNRIAYRMGIDIAFVEALIAGEVEEERFAAMVEHYRRQRHRERLRESAALPPGKRFEHQQHVERDRQRELQGEPPLASI
ncbi:MAG: hypothetical protein V2I82_01695 [Halieaceae bacterium]|nr:hypothetical protein [Halieaceae bacterium]